MKSTPKKQPAKPKRGRPPSGLATNGRIRPILPRTSVDRATLDGIRAEGRPAGRVIDDAWICYRAVETCAKRRRISVVQVIAGLEA